MMRSVTTAVTVGLLVAFSAPALAEDSKDPIKMTLHDWTGQLITTRLMGEALKNAGLNVEYVSPENELWCELWQLYCLQRLAIKDRDKLFESEYASLSAENSS